MRRALIMSNNVKKDKSVWAEIDMKILVPGSICLLILVTVGAIIPDELNLMMNNALVWIMSNFKWMYILATILIVCLVCWILFGKIGDVRFGGKNAKSSVSTLTWCTLSLTGTIAVGICFYGVSGPMGLFMNPPAFLGVEAASAEAIIPTMKYAFLHYGLPSYFIIVTFAMMMGLVHYNGKMPLKGGSTLQPLLGKKLSSGIIGDCVNVLMVVCLTVCGTNMGLAVIQLNSGIGIVSGMDTVPNYEMIIIVGYTIATVIFATSGVHKLMGILGNINAICYGAILVFVFAVSDTNRIFGLLFTSVGEFARDFIPMITFADPILQTGWVDTNTMFYYSWNFVPGMLQALFYMSIAYGRTLRQFIVVNCILPCGVVFAWYASFGGQAMMNHVDGATGIWDKMQQLGSGVATFAFLDTLPMGGIMNWLFIILAGMTFITFSDSIAYSFPLLLLKNTEVDPTLTKIPKALNAGVGIFMGVLTAVLLVVGGYAAMETAMIVIAFPVVILMLFVIVSGFKFLLFREKYDVTYQEELASEADALHK